MTEAATAGKALAEMADTVPNSGGVVGFFAGENDIEAFGKQLIPFGKGYERVLLFRVRIKGGCYSKFGYCWSKLLWNWLILYLILVA